MSKDLDNDELFLHEMGDVKPINVEKKMISKRAGPSAQVSKARREAATKVLAKDENHLASGDVELLDAYYPLEFKRAGVQHGVFRKLKQGKYPSDGRLDLHRMTIEKARKEVFEFIKQSMQYDLRSLMIIHGKGSHSGEDSALLKSYVNKWLPDMDEVQAFCSAQKQHGGMGAVYVLLRKSDRKKQENRDRINRGRVDT